MKYLRIVNELIEYPFELNSLRIQYYNTSFPDDISTIELSEYNVHLVIEVQRPSNENFTKIVTEIEPVLIDGQYYQNWLVEDAPPPYIEHHVEMQWDVIRSQRNQYLADCDWTQLPDSPLTPEKKEEWAVYRQDLRDVTLQPDPFNITWPTKPE